MVSNSFNPVEKSWRTPKKNIINFWKNLIGWFFGKASMSATQAERISNIEHELFENHFDNFFLHNYYDGNLAHF